MVTGPQIRRYRKVLGMNQVQFARRIGVSQSALSQLESGRIALSDQQLKLMQKEFVAPTFQPSFGEFLLQIEGDHEPDNRQTSIIGTSGRYETLTVWKWEDGFDLDHVPPAELAVGLVTIPMTDKASIAFEMTRDTGHWVKEEVLVFLECQEKDLLESDVCLVQYRRGRHARTSLALVERPHGRSSLNIRPLSSRTDSIPEESILILLRASIRISRD